MDIAVLSDIHSNETALRRCLDYAGSRHISRFIFLGDYVGELAYPRRTMELIYQMKQRYECYFVQGNREGYLLNYAAGAGREWQEYSSSTGALLYAYRHLDQQDLAFFRSLPIAARLTLEDLPELTICHGSPDRVNEKLLADNNRTYEILAETTSSLILCGHTHQQVQVKYNNKMLLNPGSVGLPHGCAGRTQFLLLHGGAGKWEPEFIQLTYDTQQVIAQMRESGLCDLAPYWCQITERMLRDGDLSHDMVLEKAKALYCGEMGSDVLVNIPNIPERYWEQALNTFS